MQLTLFSDYALRVALYLASHPDRLVSVEEVSNAYGISRAHLMKVVQRLGEAGVVNTTRGRGGGLRLARQPEDISIGAVVRLTEPHFNLVECFDRATNTCPIEPACGLKQTLADAQKAFLAVLDRHTLADYLPHREKLIRLWVSRPRARRGSRRRPE